jgi:hypothetical protein
MSDDRLKLADAPRALQRRVTARKHGGDDVASWAVFLDGREFVNGLTRSEVPYYKEQAYQYLLKNGEPPMPRRRKPTTTLAISTLTADDLTKLQSVAARVWDEIGYDCLQAVRECAETPRQRANPTMTREEVLEVVIDADRLRMAVLGAPKWADESQRERLTTFLKDAPYDQVLTALRPGFGFSRYGM